jgi:hypothetical protein
MTEPHEGETRPISVAELLARSGTIGAPPPGGRRRRRRGNTDAVTVAELTGEIPIVRTGEIPSDIPSERHAEPVEEAQDEAAPAAETNGADAPIADADQIAEPQAAYFEAIRGAIRGVDAEHRGVDAEHMSPDPVDEDTDAGAAEDLEPDALESAAVIIGEPTAVEAPAADDDDFLPSYLRGEREHLFGGSEPTDLITEAPTAEEQADLAAVTPMQKFLRAAGVVLQSILAVAFGAGLFLGFDELWRWNKIVALVLSVLVIIGLMVAVRIVRKTEDIGSTLIAVAVGALVTLGPLALLQSN